ncbi:hypothetical protein AMK59_4113, partial [Oryctes borbonicus]
AIRSIDNVDRSATDMLGIDLVAPIRGKIYTILAFMFLSIVLRSTLIVVSVSIDLLQQLTVFFGTFMKTFSKYQFAIIVSAISQRFERVNVNILASCRRGHAEAFLRDLRFLVRYHYKLCDVCRSMNTVFGIQLLYSIVVSMVDILFHSYCLYIGLTKKRNLFTGWAAACGVVWIIDEFIEIYFLVYACARTCSFANRTAIILHELRSNIMRYNEFEKQIQMYSIQFLHQKLKFSVLGFVVVDYSLLYSIAGAAATYLVIVIQLEEGRSSDHFRNQTSSANMM